MSLITDSGVESPVNIYCHDKAIVLDPEKVPLLNALPQSTGELQGREIKEMIYRPKVGLAVGGLISIVYATAIVGTMVYTHKNLSDVDTSYWICFGVAGGLLAVIGGATSVFATAKLKIQNNGF